MDKDNYENVVNHMRLKDGSVWPIPIVLDVSEKTKQNIEGQPTLALRDPEGVVLAYMQVTDIYNDGDGPY